MRVILYLSISQRGFKAAPRFTVVTTLQVIYPESLPKIKKALTLNPSQAGEVQIVTGFLGRGLTTGAVTTLGRGGSDLTATVIGAALQLKEVQVWKDVDGTAC